MLSKKLVEKLLDGALQDHPTYVGGRYRGYYIILDHDYKTNLQRIEICAYSDNDPGNVRLTEFLHQIKPEFGFIKHAYVENYSCNFQVTAGLNKKFIELADPLIRRVVDYLEANSYRSGCVNCGAEYNVDCYTINTTNEYLCPSCIEKVKDSLEAHKEDIKANKSNLLHGFAGAAIGALVGGAAYVLISKAGYISAITGFIMAFLALLLYEKFGGCLDVKGIICCIAVLAIMVYFSVRMAWAWEAYDALKTYGWSFKDVFSNLGDIIKQIGANGDYLKDLGLSYLFTALGAVGKFINAFRSSTGKYTIRKN